MDQSVSDLIEELEDPKTKKARLVEIGLELAEWLEKKKEDLPESFRETKHIGEKVNSHREKMFREGLEECWKKERSLIARKAIKNIEKFYGIR